MRDAQHNRIVGSQSVRLNRGIVRRRFLVLFILCCCNAIDSSVCADDLYFNYIFFGASFWRWKTLGNAETAGSSDLSYGGGGVAGGSLMSGTLNLRDCLDGCDCMGVCAFVR